MFTAVRNVISNSMHDGRWRVAAHKAFVRVAERPGRVGAAEAQAWARARATSAAALAEPVDPELWREAREVADRMRTEGTAQLAALGSPFGGPGDYALLYFLVRQRKPAVVVETGVAAGWSSRAILEALEVNGAGHLWSSDFPYLKLEDPSRHVGCLVPERLKDRWTLLLDGDRRNLPAILDTCGPVDLFHYDSDKSRRGREWAMAQVPDRLSSRAVVVVDDIGDNLFFADHVAATGATAEVVEFGGKYLGILGW